MTGTDANLVTVGRVLGAWGVKGWIRVRSYTEPSENIAEFSVWTLCQGERKTPVRLERARVHGRDGIVAKLESVDDRDAAAALTGADIAVARVDLAPCRDGEYYWADLEGLRVETIEGAALGRIDHLLRTGSNDVLVVHGDRERLIPFVDGQVVKTVDLAGGRVVVDWDPAF